MDDRLVVGLLISLLIFVWVTPALADDVTPPPVPTEEVFVETLPPTEEPVAEVLPIEPVATEEPVVVEPIATEPPTTEEPVPVDLLQDLPADTSLVVLVKMAKSCRLPHKRRRRLSQLQIRFGVQLMYHQLPVQMDVHHHLLVYLIWLPGLCQLEMELYGLNWGIEGGSAAIINGTTYNFPGMTGNWSAAKSYDLTLQGGWSGVSGDSNYWRKLSI